MISILHGERIYKNVRIKDTLQTQISLDNFQEIFENSKRGSSDESVTGVIIHSFIPSRPRGTAAVPFGCTVHCDRIF